jgi:hypothetical protein
MHILPRSNTTLNPSLRAEPHLDPRRLSVESSLRLSDHGTRDALLLVAYIVMAAILSWSFTRRDRWGMCIEYSQFL